MAKDVTRTGFSVQPTENDKGELIALRIQKWQRKIRLSDKGAELVRGGMEDVGDELEIPIGHLSDVIRELADWPTYYASGQAERDAQ